MSDDRSNVSKNRDGIKDVAMTDDEERILKTLGIRDVAYSMRVTGFEAIPRDPTGTTDEAEDEPTGQTTAATSHEGLTSKCKVSIIAEAGHDPDEIIASLTAENLAEIRPHLRTALLAMRAQLELIESVNATRH